MVALRIFALLIAAHVGNATAQPICPERVIKIVVPLSAGAQVDIFARLLAEPLAAQLKQPVIVENKLGAGGAVAAAAVAAAAPNGCTLLMTTNAHAINPSLQAKLPYDTLKSFAGVRFIAAVPNVLLVAAASPHRTLGGLLAAARATPGKVTFASAGVGSASHLAGEMLRSAAKVDFLHVPYKGASEAVQDLIGGRVDFSFGPVGSARAMLESGKARALAVTSPERSALLPDVPTLAEAGVAGYEFAFWYAVFAPATTPAPVLSRWQTEFDRALALPALRAKFAEQSAMPRDLAGAALDQFLAVEIERHAALARAAGVRPQ
jgi:tripartite-type tricarboxylate transporter receptor subunit TctC